MMGEISPGVKPLAGEITRIAFQCETCDISPMPIAIDRIRQIIETEMKEKGFSRRSLSKAADLSQTAIRDLLTRTDNPGISTLKSVAEALDMPFDRLTGELAVVPVLGKIGAGGEVMFHVEPTDELARTDIVYVPRPPLTAGKLMALEVVGSSMLPKYEDGEIIYVRRDHDGLLPEYLGRYCAVRTADGSTFLKILAAGSEPNRYTLRSLNAPDMENVEIEWASPVLFVMPKQPENWH